MFEINKHSCRFCLTFCNKSSCELTKDHADLYETATGFKINPLDTPKNICQQCDVFLQNFKRFRAQAVEVEKQLLKEDFTVNSSDVKESDDDDRPLSNIRSEMDSECDFKLFIPVVSIEKLDEDFLADRDSIADKGFPVDENAKPYRCDICKIKSFDNQTNLNRHITRIHNRRKVKKSTPPTIKVNKTQPTSCPDCGRNFKNYQRFLEHYKRVHGEKDKICHICGKGYTTQSGLSVHFQMTHSEQLNLTCFICDFCGKKFKGRHNISNHLKSWHILRECKDCDKSYYSYHSWLLHRQAVHEPLKSFQCEVCSKVFAAKKYLMQHRKVHDKEGYPCPVCEGKIFSFTTTLRSHIKFQHPEIKLPPTGTVLRNYQWGL